MSLTILLRLNLMMVICFAFSILPAWCAAQSQDAAPQSIEVAYSYPDATYHPVFLVGEPSVMHLRLDSVATDGTPALLQYQVHNFWGELIDQGSCPIQVSHGQAKVSFEPNVNDPGWYKLTLKVHQGGQTIDVAYTVTTHVKSMDKGNYLAFSIVEQPTQFDSVQRSPIGLDAAIAICDPKNHTRLVSLSRLSGCSWVRDRISWRQLNPAPGQYDWQTYDALFEKYHRVGLPVLLSYASSPAWTRQYGEQSYPSDLFAAYRFGRDCAQHWKDSIFAWEIWNEPDIAVHSKETPDRYAAMLKAIAMGYRSLPDRPLIAMGPLAREVGTFSEILFDNGVMPYLDVYDFHSYAPYDTGLFERVIKEHIQSARSHGFDSYWMSEIGQAFARDSIPDPQIAASAQAAYLVEVYTTSLSMGVQRASWFILRPYWGGGPSQFGLLRADLSPQPAYQAMAVMCRQLGSAEFLGSLPMEHGKIHLFSNGQEQVAVVLPDSKATSLPTALQGSADSRIVDLMGGQSAWCMQACEQQLVEHPGMPFYITQVTAGIIESPVYPRRVMTRRNENVPGLVALCRVPVNRVISQAGTPKSNWDGVATGWAPLAYVVKAGEMLEIPVDFYNFQQTPSSFSITVHTSNPQVQCMPASQSIKLAGMQMQTHNLTVRVPEPVEAFDFKIEANIDNQMFSLSRCRFEPSQP